MRRLIAKLRLPLRRFRRRAPEPDVRAWLPIEDVRDGLALRSDGVPVAAVCVEPAPFDLLSDRERDRRVAELREVLQGLSGPLQIVVVPCPVDLDGYIADLGCMLTTASGPRRALLQGYERYVRGLASGGQALERRCFVLLTGTSARAGDTVDLVQRAAQCAAALNRAGLAARPCDDRRWLDLLGRFLHPAAAVIGRPEAHAPEPQDLPQNEANTDVSG